MVYASGEPVVLFQLVVEKLHLLLEAFLLLGVAHDGGHRVEGAEELRLEALLPRPAAAECEGKRKAAGKETGGQPAPLFYCARFHAFCRQTLKSPTEMVTEAASSASAGLPSSVRAMPLSSSALFPAA